MKDNRTRVDICHVTTNGYSFRLRKNGDAAVYCRRNEGWHKNKPLQTAIHEILAWARTYNYYLFQWHLEHPF